jgi:DNA-binding LacI/PurR family transcriptional regulator
MVQPRPTLKDIAHAAGVTVSCVSQALRGLPSVGESTRQRIQEIARSIGYFPDPVLSALAAYRSTKRPTHQRGHLAVLFDKAAESYKKRHLAVIQEATRRLGYEITPLEIGDPGEEWGRTLRIVRARGIQGAVMLPRLNATVVFPDESLDGICLTTVGYSVRLPGICRVSTNQFLDMFRHVQSLRDLGYARMGLWASPEADQRVNGQFSGGYLAAYEQNGEAPAPIFRPAQPTRKALRAWVNDHRLEAVIGKPWQRELLQNACGAIPGKIGFSVFDWNECAEAEGMTGMDYRPERLLAGAVDLLHALLLGSRSGRLDDPPLTLYDARFRLGNTTRPAT